MVLNLVLQSECALTSVKQKEWECKRKKNADIMDLSREELKYRVRTRSVSGPCNPHA